MEVECKKQCALSREMDGKFRWIEIINLGRSSSIRSRYEKFSSIRKEFWDGIVIECRLIGWSWFQKVG